MLQPHLIKCCALQRPPVQQNSLAAMLYQRYAVGVADFAAPDMILYQPPREDGNARQGFGQDSRQLLLRLALHLHEHFQNNTENPMQSMTYQSLMHSLQTTLLSLQTSERALCAEVKSLLQTLHTSAYTVEQRIEKADTQVRVLSEWLHRIEQAQGQPEGGAVRRDTAIALRRQADDRILQQDRAPAEIGQATKQNQADARLSVTRIKRFLQIKNAARSHSSVALIKRSLCTWRLVERQGHTERLQIQMLIPLLAALLPEQRQQIIQSLADRAEPTLLHLIEQPQRQGKGDMPEMPQQQVQTLLQAVQTVYEKQNAEAQRIDSLQKMQQAGQNEQAVQLLYKSVGANGIKRKWLKEQVLAARPKLRQQLYFLLKEQENEQLILQHTEQNDSLVQKWLVNHITRTSRKQLIAQLAQIEQSRQAAPSAALRQSALPETMQPVERLYRFLQQQVEKAKVPPMTAEKNQQFSALPEQLPALRHRQGQAGAQRQSDFAQRNNLPAATQQGQRNTSSMSEQTGPEQARLQHRQQSPLASPLQQRMIGQAGQPAASMFAHRNIPPAAPQQGQRSTSPMGEQTGPEQARLQHRQQSPFLQPLQQGTVAQMTAAQWYENGLQIGAMREQREDSLRKMAESAQSDVILQNRQAGEAAHWVEGSSRSTPAHRILHQALQQHQAIPMPPALHLGEQPITLRRLHRSWQSGRVLQDPPPQRVTQLQAKPLLSEQEGEVFAAPRQRETEAEPVVFRYAEAGGARRTDRERTSGSITQPEAEVSLLRQSAAQQQAAHQKSELAALKKQLEQQKDALAQAMARQQSFAPAQVRQLTQAVMRQMERELRFERMRRGQ